MQLPDLSLLLVMVVFWATYWVLRLFVLEPLGAILEEREATQASAEVALEAALEQQKAALAELDKRLTQARREALSMREAVRAAANARRQAVLDEARDESTKTVEAAQRRLEQEIAAAREQLRDGARATAAEIATIALGRKVA
jgi:F-type H+-transporting ATPase subunit b